MRQHHRFTQQYYRFTERDHLYRRYNNKSKAKLMKTKHIKPIIWQTTGRGGRGKGGGGLGNPFLFLSYGLAQSMMGQNSPDVDRCHPPPSPPCRFPNDWFHRLVLFRIGLCVFFVIGWC